jgi:hypothetical protein
VHLHRAADDELMVVLDTERTSLSREADDAFFEGEEADGASSVARPELRSELIVLEDVPEVDGAPLVFVFYSPFKGGGEDDGAFVMRFSLASSPTDPEEHRCALERCASDLEHSPSLLPGALLEDLERPASATHGPDPGLAGRRAALAIVADASDALLCRDLALAGDSETVDALLERLAARDEPASEAGWRVEREAYLLLVARSLAGGLPPELQAILLLHAGEVGRYPGQLERFLRASDDRESFTAFMIAENRSFLTDSSLASRARANAWLEARDLAPENFDPLASAAERRTVLRAYATSIEEESVDAEERKGRR